MLNDKDGGYDGLDFRQLLTRFFKYSFSYGTFNLISRVGGFLLYPLFWKYLSPDDFGIIGMTSVVQALVGALMTLGLESGVGRFFYEWTPEERATKIGSLWTLSLVTGVLITLLCIALGPWLSPLIIAKVSFSPYLSIAVWTAFASSMAVFPFTILRMSENIHFYGSMTLANFVVNTGLSIWFVAYLKYGALGMLYATLLTSGAWGIFWFVWMLKRISLRFHYHEVRAEIRFSLPSLPLSILLQMDSALDRLFIDKYVTLSRIGIYSLGKKFGEYYGQVNQSLKAAWFPMTYKMSAQRKDFPQLLPRLSMVYFLILGGAALATSLLSREFILMFGKAKYAGVYSYVPIFVLGFFLQNFATAWGRGMDLAKKPQHEMIPVLMGLPVNVLLLAFLVPRFHLFGAVAAFTGTSFVKTAAQVFLAHKFYPRHFPALGIAATSALLLGIFFIGFLFPPANLFGALAFHCGLLVLYSGLAWIYIRRIRGVLAQG